MRNIFQLKQAWDREVLLKLCVTRGDTHTQHSHKHKHIHTYTHNSSYCCICAFVYAPVTSIHMNYYFTVESVLIMIESGCTEAVFSYLFMENNN